MLTFEPNKLGKNGFFMIFFWLFSVNVGIGGHEEGFFCMKMITVLCWLLALCKKQI